MTLVFGKKTRRDYHHISLKEGYLIPLQAHLLGKSNCQYVGSNTRTTGEDSDLFSTERTTYRVSLSGPASNGMVTGTIAADVAQDAVGKRDVSPTSDNQALIRLPEAVEHDVELE